MIIVTKTELKEVAVETKKVSDFDPSKDAVALLYIDGGQGSSINLKQYCFDLDEEMTQKILNLIKNNLPQGKDIEDFV